MSYDRRQFMYLAGATAAMTNMGLPGLNAKEPQEAVKAKRPNILVLFADQHSGMFMGCAGHDQVKTPHMDALAQSGTYFPYCVANHPVCCPQRATMMTGVYAHQHGLRNNDKRLVSKHKHFAEVFAEAGYATGYCGKWHLDGGIPKKPEDNIVPKERRRGWQDWHGHEKGHSYFKVYDYDDEKRFLVDGYDWEPTWHTDLILDFAKRQRDADKPWIYFASYGPPHKPEECPKSWLDAYPQKDITLNPKQRAGGLSTDKLREASQTYMGQVSSVDHEFGRVTAGLKELGVDDNTIIIYTADHGDLLGAHGRLRGKSQPWCSASRVPFIITGPGIVQASHELPVSGIDVPPTLLALAGLDIPETMMGNNLADLCRGGAAPAIDVSYMRMHNWQAIFDGQYMYAPTYQACYDWKNDPWETKNLWEDKDLTAKMEAKLQNKLAKIGSGKKPKHKKKS